MKYQNIFPAISLFLIFMLSGCGRQTIKTTSLPPKQLPPEKEALLAYHPAKFLRTVLVSAPLLSAENHRHGWQKQDCVRCHKTPSQDAPNVCFNCHGHNGIGGQKDTCGSCHKVQNELGYPSSGNHTFHVMKGPEDKNCVQCHPGRDSNSHADGTLNVQFARGGKYIAAKKLALERSEGSKKIRGSCSGIACHEDRDWGGESCSSCHASPPNTGYHKVHLETPGLTCRNCHNDNQHDSDRKSGSIEIGGIEYDFNTGDCTATCHGETLKWKCDSCHGYPPKTGNHEQSIHKEFTCDGCHDNHIHSYKAAMSPMDFSDVQVAFNLGGDYKDETKDGIANGLCSNLDCHEARIWGSSCNDCHGNPPDTGIHVLHVKREGNVCDDCHAGREHDLDNKSGFIDIGDIEYDSMTGNCTPACHGEPMKWKCDSCHGYPPDSGIHLSHSKVIDCKECHADHKHSYKAAVAPMDFATVKPSFAYGGEYNPSDGRCSDIGCHESFRWTGPCSNNCHDYPPDTGFHLGHIEYTDINCDSCHKDRQHDLEDESGSIEVGGIAYNKFSGGCSSTCHQEEKLWECDTCHDNPPNTGKHLIHTAKLNFSCRVCHENHEHSYKVTTAPKKTDGAIVKFSKRGDWNKSTMLCSKIACHGNRRWVNTR